MGKRVALIAGVFIFGGAHGAALVCAEDADTSKRMCFPEGPLSASTDKVVREAPLYSGGPRGVEKVAYALQREPFELLLSDERAKMTIMRRVFADKISTPSAANPFAHLPLPKSKKKATPL